MTFVSFIAKNALRNKRRALLSIMSVAVSLFLFVILQVGLREVTLPVEDIGHIRLIRAVFDFLLIPAGLGMSACVASSGAMHRKNGSPTMN